MPHDPHDPYASPFTQPFDRVLLKQIKTRISISVGPSLADRMELTRAADFIAQKFAYQLETSVLAEELPPITIDERKGFTVPRFATWWDHFKAANWNRWWMWLFRDLGWIKPARFVDEPHTYVATVDVRGHWTYPRATTVLPGREFGHVVYKGNAYFGDSRVRPW